MHRLSFRCTLEENFRVVAYVLGVEVVELLPRQLYEFVCTTLAFRLVDDVRDVEGFRPGRSL